MQKLLTKLRNTPPLQLLKQAILLSIGLFLVAQLVPYGRNHTNPPVVTNIAWDSPETEQLVKAACYDCHSNETIWPWYSNIAPVSWLVQRDTEEGREKLNFSEWSTAQTITLRQVQDDDEEEEEAREGGERENGVDEIVEQIEKGKMPPLIYPITHPNARMSDADRAQLIAGIRASLG
ncbi:MAG TPA: hypothetical protein ENJ56_06350, partial [Anaerolineae bacterium]|nr:hypothetical protein [Anaerolineae bacterium]